METMEYLNRAVAAANEQYVTVAALMCGMGKSTYISERIAQTLTSRTPEGMLIVTDEVQRMHSYLEPHDAAVRAVIQRHKGKVVVMSQENADEAQRRSWNAPVLIITTQRYFRLTRKEIKQLLKWSGGQRELILFDEKLYLIAHKTLTTKTFTDVEAALQMGIDDTVEPEEKAWAISEWKRLAVRVQTAMDAYEQLGDRQFYLYHRDSEGALTADDDRFRRILNDSRSKLLVCDANTIESSVTSISHYAFYDAGLETIRLSQNLSVLGYNVFSNTKLTSVALPDSLTSMDVSVFSGCASLTTVKLPGSLTVLPNGTFFNCKALKSVELPSGLKKIDESAFLQSGLEQIEIPDGVTSIGKRAFRSTKLTSFDFPEGVSKIEDEVFYGTALTNVNLPEQLVSVGSYAFYGSKLGNGLKWPESLTSLGEFAFYGAGLTGTLDIPDTLTQIGKSAFANNSLESLALPEGLVTIGEKVFSGNHFSGEIRFPSTLRTIGKGAFSGNWTATDFTPLFNDGLETIGEEAFSNSRLRSLTLPASLKTIGAKAFYFDRTNSGTFSSLVIPEGIEAISANAFAGNRSLKTVTIPATVQSIGDNAFGNCTNLEKVNMPANVDFISASAFSGSTKVVLQISGRGSVMEYAQNNGIAFKRTDLDFEYSLDENNNATLTRLVKAMTNVEIPAEIDGFPVVSVAPNLLLQYSSVRKVVLPDADIELQTDAFKGMRAWDGSSETTGVIVLPAGVRNIRDGAIPADVLISAEKKSAAHAYAVAHSVKFVCPEAPYNYTVNSDGSCTITGYCGWANAEVPSEIDGHAVTSIGAGAFNGSIAESIILPDSVTTLENNAFHNLEAVVYVPASVTKLGSRSLNFVEDTLMRPYLVEGSAAYTYWRKNSEYLPFVWDGQSLIFDTLFIPGEKDKTIPYDVYGFVKRADQDADLVIPAEFAGRKIISLKDTLYFGRFSDTGLNSITLSEGIEALISECGSFVLRDSSAKHIYLPRSLTRIDNGTIAISENSETVLHVYADSFAHQYVVEHNLTHELIDANTKFAYTETDEGVIITDYRASGSTDSLSIPATINGKPIIGIGANAFAGAECTFIIVPESVISIGDGAFVGVRAEGNVYISIAATDVEFGEAVFDAHVVLNSLPDDDTAAYAAANGLTHYPTEGKYQGFGYKLDWRSQRYEINWFDYSSKHIVYPGELFGLPVYKVSHHDNANFALKQQITHLTIPENVTEIESLSEFSNLAQVDLPDTLEIICDNTFSGLKQINLFVLPESVKHLGYRSMPDASHIICYAKNIAYADEFAFDFLNICEQRIYCYPDSGLKNFVYVINDLVDLTLVKFSADMKYAYTVTNGNATIADYLGSEQEFEIPEALDGHPVKAIGEKAFAYSRLKNVKVPSCITGIGNYAFRTCYEDGEVVLRIPGTIKTFGKNIYPKQTVRLVTHLNARLVANAVNAGKDQYIYYSDDLEFSYSCSYSDDDELRVSGIDGYWGLSKSVTLPSTHAGQPATTVHSGTFRQGGTLEKIVVPEGYTKIESGVFLNNCAKQIYLPQSLIDFGELPITGITYYIYPGSHVHRYLFNNLSGYGALRYVLIGSEDIFAYRINEDGATCTLTDVNTDDKIIILPRYLDGYEITGIDPYAFANTAPDVIFVGSQVYTVASHAFSGIRTKDDVIIAFRRSYCSFGEDVFDRNAIIVSFDDNGLASHQPRNYAEANGIRWAMGSGTVNGFEITFDGAGYVIKNYVGTEPNVVVPKQINGIPVIKFEHVWYNAYIRQLVIPDGLTAIGVTPFYGCENLVFVKLPADLTGPITFSVDYGVECPKLKCIVLPEGVTHLHGNLHVDYLVVLNPKMVFVESGCVDDAVAIYGYKNSTAQKYVDINEYRYWTEFRTISTLNSATAPIVLELMPMTVEAEVPAQMEMILLPENSYTQKWTSSDEAVATVSNGIITGHRDGTANIKLTIGKKSASATVTVRTPLQDFALAAEKVDMAIGQTMALGEVSRMPAAASDAIAYTVSDASVISVDAQGNVTGLKRGEAVLTATSANGIVRTCVVSVFAPVTELTLSDSVLEISAFGTAKLTATVTSGSEVLTNRMVKFVSSNPDVAVVSEDGMVTLTGNGTCWITVTVVGNDELSKQCEIIVIGYHAAQSVTIAGTGMVGVNGKVQLSAIIQPENASDRCAVA